MLNATPAGPADPLPPLTPAASRRAWLPRSAWGLLYGLYAWLQFLLIGVLTVLLLAGPFSLTRRRKLVSGAARLGLRLAGMRLHLHAREALPHPCVIVANHCSYLDGVVLAALLPDGFSFVIKREMARVPLAGSLLRRIGVEFVERRAHGQVLRDTRRLLRHAQDGHALVFFPEGTFSVRVGLLRFHIGAFAAAARANVPVVPIAIRGTRHCLAPGTIWPRPGRIDVQLLPALPASHAHVSLEARAGWLRERARAELLSSLGEPDLAGHSA